MKKAISLIVKGGVKRDGDMKKQFFSPKEGV
jgi:hypothetical protein